MESAAVNTRANISVREGLLVSHPCQARVGGELMTASCSKGNNTTCPQILGEDKMRDQRLLQKRKCGEELSLSMLTHATVPKRSTGSG